MGLSMSEVFFEFWKFVDDPFAAFRVNIDLLARCRELYYTW